MRTVWTFHVAPSIVFGQGAVAQLGEIATRLRAKKALTDLKSGQVLRVLATDPGSVKDFQAFSKQTGNELLASETAAAEFVFFMKKK